MRPVPAIALPLALLLAGCGKVPGVPGAGELATSAARKAPMATASRTTAKAAHAAPTATGLVGKAKADLAARGSRLAAAIFDVAPSREIARSVGVTAAVAGAGAAIVADGRNSRFAGGPLISDKSGGLVSKIRTGVVSNNGGSVISNNGGNGLATGDLDPTAATTFAPRYAVLQAPAAGHAIRHRDGAFQYVTTFGAPGEGGHLVGYRAAEYDRRGASAEVIEDMAWDAMPVDILPGPSRGLFGARLQLPVRVERSRRLAFTRRIDVTFDVAVTALVPVVQTAFEAMSVDFTMAVPRRTGGSEALVMHARDFSYPPGAGPGETPDGLFPTPTGFAADGANAQGTLTLRADASPAGDGSGQVESRFVRADGTVVEARLRTDLAGRRTERVRDGVDGLEAELAFEADGHGAGEVRDPATGARVGRLSWNAAGQGALALDGRPATPVRVF